MENIDLNSIINNLSNAERLALLNKLKSVVLLSTNNTVKEVIYCPCCNETNFIKNGSYKSVQKYKCKNTSNVFTYKSKTILSGITKLDKLESLLEMMVSKKMPTITEIQLTLKVSRQTAFDWRTKVLTSIYKEIDFNNQIIEFDETNFRLSTKGRKGVKESRKRGVKLVGDNKQNVKVFMSYSRTTKQLELVVSHLGRTTSDNVDNYLGVKKELVIYSDRHPSYKTYFKQKGIEFSTFKSTDHILKTNNTVHNQTINYHCGLLQRILNEELKGVSTKYLQGYLNWYMFVENVIKKEVVELESVVLTNKVGYDIYKQKEREYNYLLVNNGVVVEGRYNDRHYGNK